MKFSSTARTSSIEDKAFLLLVAVVTAAFLWVILPYFSAVFWGAVFALLFRPLFMLVLKKMPGKRSVAALLTLLVILLLVILPLGFITASLVQEAGSVYQRLQSGELNVAKYFQQVYAALPEWVTGLLNRFGLNDFGVIQEKVSASISQGSQFIAAQALNIGQNTFDFVVAFFVMLYLLFFLLRDGASLARRIERAVPLDDEVKRDLGGKFTTVIRATVKGNVAVAVLQGALGGLTFWMLGIHGPILWGTLMAFLSLLPAVGAALVWGPVALYFLATGAIVQGLVLIAVGVLVIGMVDNILRPVLVGKDTKMPDYLVLISTLGGMALFGLNGFVIGPVVAAMFIAVWNIFSDEREAGLHDAASPDSEPVPAPVVPVLPVRPGHPEDVMVAAAPAAAATPNA
ncbi:MAG: AI-2E family transporter [Comamonadaceae bacterium]|nr:MAG: AI-2E family transporter [Comamonadaceae bacterium]